MEQFYTNHSVSFEEKVSKKTRSFKNRIQFYKFIFLSCVLFLFFGPNLSAQNINNYAFSFSNTASLEDMSNGTTSLLTGNFDDTATTVQQIGFDFYFMGMLYTHYSVNSNGQVRLHSNGNAAPISGSNITAYTASTVTLAPMAGDNEVNGGIRIKLVGSAPNRKLVIEWVEFYVQFANISNAGNMQLWLNETSGKIDYLYGEIFNSTASTQSRSIFISSGNTATASGHVTIGATPVFTAAATPVANTIPASSSITGGIATPLVPNLGSSANGSRWMYSFTPLNTTVVGDVTNITFSAVAANSMTLNWEDNASNESSFVVERATNAAFTENLFSTSVPSTSSATSGTLYNLNQTGLSSGTLYYYRVYAAVEAGLSLPTNGTQATLNGVTYYWIGGNNGAWGSFGNWNTSADGSGSTPTEWTNSDIHIIDGEGTTPGGSLTIQIDRASFTIGQFIVNNNTNLTLQSSNTTTRTLTVSGGPGDDFVIASGSSLNLTNATQAVAFAFSGMGNGGLIAGNYTVGGSLSNNLTTTGGTGTLVTVASTGIVTSNLNSSSAGLVGNAASLLFTNGSNWIHQNSTTVNYIPTATWQPTATATLNGNTTGTTLTSTSPVLGNLIVNTTASTATLSAFTTTVRTIQGDLTVNSTGTGRFRATTSGLLTINGNLIINGGIFEVGSLGNAGVIVKGNTIIAPGATLDLNRNILQNEGNMINNGSVLSSETTTTNSTINFIGTTVPQTLSGSGTFTGRVSSFGVSNPSGLTISTPVLTQRVNLFVGNVTGANNITIGTGLALGAAVQIGTAGNTNSGGSFDTSPVFNLGTGSYTLLYLNEVTPRNTGFEVPPSRVVNTIILDNANGLTITGGVIEALTGLTLTNGIVNSSLANHIVLGSTTTAGTLTGGSATSYINGPFVRTINDANANTNFVHFPVGKTGVYAPIWLAPSTTSASRFRAESFNSNTGTANPSIINLTTNRRWEAPLVSGTFTDINVRLGDANILATSIPVQSLTASGEYTNSFGSVATAIAGESTQSNSAAPSANFTGFLSFADSNTCNGTPSPGNTLATSTSICLGQSITLSLQNSTSGTGVTYQWKSSTDGITYTNIVNATNATLSVTPTEAVFYLCEVTCSSGPATGTSTAIQITLANEVLTTTPATRCGEGTLVLSATANSGATINWYDAASNGQLLGSGTSFTTPSISATTTYYASASTPTSGSVTIGSGTSTTTATTQPSAFVNRWPSYRIQTLYTAQELLAAGLVSGDITSMSYFTTTLGDGATNANFTVKIGTSSQTTMTTVWVPTTSFTTVYGPVTHTHTASGEQPINFTTPFNWDGESNIVIEVTYNGADLSNNAVTFFTTTPSNMVVHSNTSGLAAASGTVTTTRLNLKLQGQVACNSIRVPVVATVTTPPTLTISASTTEICNGQSSDVVTLTEGGTNYDTFVWNPSTGVSGDAITGWTFNPTVTTSYTLTASQSTGDLCVTTTSINVVVNSLPSALIVTPSAPTVCVDAIQQLSVSGGLVSSIVLQENFNGATNNWVTENTSTGASSAATAWTLRNSPYTYSTYGSFSSNDNSQFYMSNSDAGGSGSVTNTALVSPSFSTVGLTTATVSFWHYFRQAGTAKVDYSIDNGVTWTTLQNYTTTVGTPASFVQANLTLPAEALNQTNVKIRFKYDASWQYFWALDNVSVSGTPISSFTWSPATNLFTDVDATVPYVSGTNASTVYVKSSSDGSFDYTVTSTAVTGCTNSANVSVVVNSNTTNTTTLSACDTYTWSVNGQTYTASGTYTFVSGCNTEELVLTITPSTTNTTTVSACDSYTWSVNGQTYTASGTYTFVSGCNTEELVLTITPSTTNTITVSACDTYTWSVNGQTYTTSGTYTFVSGCNTEELVLTINANPTTAITRVDNILTVDQAGASYQWLTCDGSGFTAISGANSQSYEVTTIGSYAVEVTINGCTVVSPCFEVATLSTSSFNMSQLLYYPNPVVNNFTISYSNAITSVQVYDMSGRLVKNMKTNTNEVNIDMSDVAASVYVVRVMANGTTGEFKIVKK